MDDLNPIERLGEWVKNSIGLKLFVILTIILVLLIPSSMIRSLIREREGRQADAIAEISSHWASAQNVGGPFLSIPYKVTVKGDDDKIETKTRYARFLPTKLSIVGDIDAETRYRGMFDALVYTSTLNLSGTFPEPSFDDWDLAEDQILWDDAFVSFLISDLRGLRDYPTLTWNDTNLTTRPSPGPGGGDLAGIYAPVSLSLDENGLGPTAFSASITLKGSRGLYFLPLGKETSASITSNWHSPSFQGSFLPDTRETSDSGFAANWKVLDLNRSYPQQWRGDLARVQKSRFGVDLISPVDEYRQTTRSAKYAGLFLLLTFVAVFLVEIASRRKVHPFQYLLIGCALVVFFVLLLSLSEHMSFSLAYVIASGTITLLIGAYARAALRRLGGAAIVGGIVATLYAVLYVVLQLEDFALLIGSLALLLAIAAVMYFTRSIDWYNVGSAIEEPKGSRAGS